LIKFSGNVPELQFRQDRVWKSGDMNGLGGIGQRLPERQCCVESPPSGRAMPHCPEWFWKRVWNNCSFYHSADVTDRVSYPYNEINNAAWIQAKLGFSADSRLTLASRVAACSPAARSVGPVQTAHYQVMQEKAFFEKLVGDIPSSQYLPKDLSKYSAVFYLISNR